jgi:hypothetical protein
MSLAPISATVIDAMLSAGASRDQLAMVARQQFPEIIPTIDALISTGAAAALIGQVLKAHAADRGAAVREADRRKRNTDARRAKRQAANKKSARPARPVVPDPQYELPMSADIEDIADNADNADPLPSSFPPHPPNNYPPHFSEPDGSDAIASAHEVVVLNEDPKAQLFREGRTLLASFGVAPKQQGSLIGLWLKRRPDPAGVLAAIRFARDQNVAEPVAYISTVINGDKNDGRFSGSKDWRGGGFARLAAQLGARCDQESDFGA